MGILVSKASGTVEMLSYTVTVQKLHRRGILLKTVMADQEQTDCWVAIHACDNPVPAAVHVTR